MKKKLFLGLLPTLLVLASCQAAPRADIENKPQPIPEEQQFLEDNEAHDEIFGDSVLSGDLGIRKLPTVPVASNDDSIPTLGIQYNDSTPGYVSLRFIAAIKVTDLTGDSVVDDADLACVNAYWDRAIFKPDGTVQKQVNADRIFSTKAYTSLGAKNGIDTYTIEDLNTAKGTNYTHFVVYTILNIPTSCLDYYVMVKCSFEDLVHCEETRSPWLITSVDRETQILTSSLANGYTLIKKTSEGYQPVDAAADAGEGNLAKFENVSLNANESIAIIYHYFDLGTLPPDFSTEQLKIYNYADKGDNGSYFFAAEEGLAKVNYEATYTFTLTSGGKINVSATNIVRPIYAKIKKDTSELWWWGNDDRFTALYAFKKDGEGNTIAEEWFKMDLIEYHPNDGEGAGGYLYYKTQNVINPATYSTVIVVEMLASAKELPASSYGWSYKNNQSEDEVILPNSTEDCVHVYSPCNGGVCASSFGLRPY